MRKFAAKLDSMTPKFHQLTISDIRKETEDTVSVAFDVPADLQEAYAYLPGQYLTIKATINGEELRRSYSLCSAPFEKEWRVAIKQVEGGRFSSYANNELKVGDQLDVMTPTGNFKLSTSADHEGHYLMVAAGSGVTPVLSIAKTALHEEEKSLVTFVYGNRNINSIIFKEEIEALKNEYMDRFQVIHILSRESLGNPLQKGRIDKDKADQIYRAHLSHENISGVYVCGPEQMIMSVKDSMIDNGLPKEKIHFELFTTPTTTKQAITQPTNSPKVESNVSIILDDDRFDIHLDSNGQNILDAAQESGADLPFSCKGGVCCTCKAKILEGTASMDVNYALEPEEVEAGYILTCQAHPTSDKLVVSFDE